MSKHKNNNNRQDETLKANERTEALQELTADPATEPQETWNQGVDLLEDRETAKDKSSQQKAEEK